MYTDLHALRDKHIFEQPLTELIRHCLKVERIMSSIDTQLGDNSVHTSQFALLECVWLLRLLERADIRTKLMQWLVSFQSKCRQWHKNGSADQVYLNDLVQQVNVYSREMSEQKQRFRIIHDPFLKSVDSLDLSSGLSACNHPLMQVWKSQQQYHCRDQINKWLSYVTVEIKVVHFILKVLRSSQNFERHEASDGFYQLSLDSLNQIQLLRVKLHSDGVFPKVSVGKQRCSLAFYRYDFLKEDFSCQDLQSRSFDLACCSC